MVKATTSRRSRRWLEVGLAFLMAAAMLAVAPGNVPEARAANLLVDPGQACGPAGPVYCAIQEGVAAANPGGGDVVQIADGTYFENVTVGIPVAIEALSQGGVTVDGGAAGAVFAISSGAAVTLDGLRITNGSSASGAGVSISGGSGVTITDSHIFGNSAAGASGRGGGVFISASALVLDRSSLTGNTAERGGGIYVESTGIPGLIARDTTIDGNTSTLEGGAIYQLSGTAAISNATITGNSASSGAAYFAGGSATLFNTVVAANTSGSPNPACDGGGAVTSLGYNFISRVGPSCSSIFTASGDITGTVADPLNPRLGPLQDNGGVGLSRIPESDSPLLDVGDNGVTTTLDQLGNARIVDGVADAVAQADIGAVELDPLTVCAAGCEYTFLDGGAIPALVDGDVIAIGNYTLTNEFIRIVDHADIVLQGRGIGQTIVSASSDADPLTPRDATFRVGHAQNIGFAPGVSVTIRDLTMMSGDRSGGGNGGGFSVFANPGLTSEATLERVRVTDNLATKGGGLENSSETLTVIDSIIDNNATDGIGSSMGGGVYATGGTTEITGTTIRDNFASAGGGIAQEFGPGVINVRNSTITGNNAQNGGGLYNSNGGTTNLNNVTVWLNDSGLADTLETNGGGTYNVNNSILAEPAGENTCLAAISGDNNILSEDTFCFLSGNNNQIGFGGGEIDPLLGPLADNGGVGQTFLPQPGSPAIGTGNNATCEPTDQRGLDRPVGPVCDIGAVEAAAVSLQSLIDAAPVGGTINAPAFTFFENITIGDGKTLIGAGPGLTVIDGNGSRTVDLTGDATLQDLTVQNGSADESTGGNVRNLGFDLVLDNVAVDNGNADAGGNIFNTGNLDIVDSVITNGGAAFNGGAINTSGPVTIAGSVITDNDATGNGGAIYVDSSATLAIEAPTSCVVANDPASFTEKTDISGNTSFDAFGGGIYNLGNTAIYETLFFNNNAERGGAIEHAGGSLTIGCSSIDNNGAAIAPATGISATNGVPLTVDATLFVRNGATGPALTSDGVLTVTGSKFEGVNQPSALSLSGTSYVGSNNQFINHSGQAFFAQTSNGFTSTGSTFTGNGNSGQLGGAMFVQDPDAQISGAVFTGNIGDQGGAIYNNFDLTVTDSTFTGNLGNDGGAVATVGDLNVVDSTFSGNTANLVGGAVASVPGEINITGSTFTGNSATGALPFAGGAAYFAEGGIVANSTFSANLAPNGGGGAIAVDFKPIEIRSSTLVDNTSAQFGGAVAAATGVGTELAQIGNSILANNFVGILESQCFQTGSLGYNIFGTIGCNPVASDQEGGDPIEPGFVPLDPVIGPLQDNGGPTQTHALLAGSPAIDAAEPASGIILTAAGDDVTIPPGSSASVNINEEILLTDGPGQAGTVWSDTPIDVGSSFSATFEFQITNPNPFGGQPSGDGLTFALSDSPLALGDAAGRLGIGDFFGGSPVTFDSVSVEFDTYANGIEFDNHVGINVGSDLDPISTDAIDSDVELPAAGAFDDGAIWTAWVDYDAVLKRLEVRFSNAGVRPANAFISAEVDLTAEFTGSVYPGFTAGTGAAWAEHTILNWEVTAASSCTVIDQRGVGRPQGLGCDIGSFELLAVPAVLLDLNSAAVVDSGASTIATTDLPSSLANQPTDPTDPTDDNLASAPIANIDTQSTAVESSPIANIPIANIPIANIPAEAQAVVDAILLVDVPLEGGWEVHLAASPTLAGRPIQSVTLGEAMADADVLASLDAAGLTFNDINLASTPIANISIAGLALGSLPIANIPLDAADTTPSDILQAWCDALAAQPVNCSTLGINPALGDDGGHSLASLSIAGADLSTLPIANIPIANIPIANIPIANIPVGDLILTDSPIANIPIANIPIANIPIANIPIANIPIANIPIANIEIDGTPIANIPIANIPIANIGPDGLPIANIPIANIPIANIPIANIGLLVDCSQPAVFDCNAPGVTVGDAYLATAPPGQLLFGSLADWAGYISIDDLLQLGVITDAATGQPIDFNTLFNGLDLGDLVDGGGFANLGIITLQDLADLINMTLGELLIVLIDAGFDILLGDVLLLLVNPEDYPWEDLELDGINLQEFDNATSPTVFSAEVTVINGGGGPGQVSVTLPDDFVFISVDGVTTPVGVSTFTFSVTGQTVLVDIPAMPDGLTTVEVSAAASLSVGATSASSTATVGGVLAESTTLLQVTEVLEPNDTPELATPVVEDTIYLTHIATEGDVDIYAIPGIEAGARVSVILSNMSEDLDLVLYQPELPPLRPGGVTPEGIATGVTDPGGYVDGDEQLQNEVSGDFPRATFADGTALGLYETSTQQGTSDEVITTATLQAAGTYYVQVHGNNGATSPDPYALRVEVIETPTSLACSPLAKPFDGQGTPGTEFTPGPGPYNTMILYNEQRLGDFYGAAAANDVRDALQSLAGQNALGVNAIVVPVESDPLVAAEYVDWDADRCNPLAANALAAQIGRLVDDYRALYPTIEYITVVGDDGQLPFFRVPDYTEIANESEYALSVSATNNELVGSLLAGFVLTDDPYGDANPLRIDGRDLYISELPIGRMVESPADIIGAVDNFVQFNGRLDPNTASTGLSTGYDFIEDGANAIRDALNDDPRRTTTTLNSDNAGPLWDSAALANIIDSLVADVVSLGAHMAHDGLLSAAEDTAGTQADLYEPIDAQNQVTGIWEGTIIFSMGCHSGLSVSDVQVGATSDWAQTFSQLGAVYAAETGFGYGDTEIVAYGEELMAQFAARLNGSMTVGQAMGFAKQFHAANLSQYSPYDEKVLMETVVYGLPFYAVGDPTAPPPAPPVLPTTVDAATGLPQVTTSFDYGDGAPGADGEFILEDGGDRGDYYTANGDAQATAFNPIQPRATETVTQPGLTGTGVFISELTSVDKPNFDPVFSRPTVDLAAREPEVSLPGTFPLVLPGINSYLDFDGEREQLVVVLGQFTDTDGKGEAGTERLFTHVEANVLYGDPSDLLVPTIRSAKAVDGGAGGLLTFSVDAFDQDGLAPGTTDVARVYVLYKLAGANGAWLSLDLANVGDRWVGAVPSLGGKVEFIVQAVDFNGLVGYHSNKTAGNESTEIPVPQPGGTEIEVNGGPVEPVYETDPVTIAIVGADEGTPVNVDVDGSGFEPYDGPFDVTGEGPHVVTVDDGSGTPESVVFVIDTMGPAIFINSPIGGAVYSTGSVLLADYQCTDAGVGADSCDGAIVGGDAVADGGAIDTSVPGTYTLSVSSSDSLGNGSTASVEFEIADPVNLCEVAVATITGTAGHDVIFGTSGPDVIFSLGGNDLVFAKGGDDIICLGDGHDTVYAGSGDDYVEGNDGWDLLYGGSGHDTMRGGNGNDSIFGQGGNDLMAGGLGNDSIWGAFGNDTVTYAEATGSITVKLNQGWSSGEGSDALFAIENAIGSEYADTMIGSWVANELLGLGGDDLIKGRGGSDAIIGGLGDDELYGNGGGDFLDGSEGNDWIHGGAGQDACANGETVFSCEIV